MILCDVRYGFHYHQRRLTKGLKLFINGQEKRQENTAPYEWGHMNSRQPRETIGLAIGDHEFKVVQDSRGGVSESSLTLTARESIMDIDELRNNSFVIYPNPSEDIFRIRISKDWKVYTLTGKIVAIGCSKEINR